MKTGLLPIVLAWGALAQAPTSWTSEFAMQFQSVSSVVPSPDGQWVAWTQIRNVIDTERSEQVSQIYLARADGSHRLQLTHDDKGSSNPSFSPDGGFIYFTSDRSGKNNIYRIAVAGGEAEKLTDFKGALGTYKVSPDGKWVAYTGAETPADEEKAKKEKRDFRVVDEDRPNNTLFLIPAEAAADGKRAAKKVLQATYHVESFDWSPDSRRIAFEHQPSSFADDWTKADISELHVESGQVKVLAATAAAETKPFYSPDGLYLAFTRTSIPVRWPGEERIVALPLRGGEPRVLLPTPDETPSLVGWTGDSSRILFVESKRTRSALFAIPVDGPPQVVYEPSAGALNFAGARVNLRRTHVGFPYENSQEAPEAFVIGLAGGAPTRVSRANLDLPKLPLGKTEVIRWKSKDGLEVEGLLTYPADYQAGKKYPLILNIHGGPAGVFSETFIGKSGLYPIATFAAHGYAVLRPNPRGSSGYGKQFRFANVGDWGGRDYEDDQAGVDQVIAMGIADPERMAVMGWSYGGYMTSWTITQTKRFKAAVIGAGVTNLWSFTGTSDIPGFLPDYFGGEQWEQFDAFRKHSPMAHIKNVTTPTLILHGEADVRVPTTQGYEYYGALKRLGVTAKMVVYPRTPHGPREPKFLLDIMQRHLDWVEKYVR